MQNTTICINCQHTNPSGTKFCHSCASLMEYSCSACGSVSPQGSRSCLKCGMSFVKAPPTKFINPNPHTSQQASAQPEPPPQVSEAQSTNVAAPAEKMERVCSACGAVNEESDRFCFKCGLPLGAATQASRREHVRAGFMIRLGAYLVDQIVLFLVGFVLLSIFMEAINPGITANQDELTVLQQVIIYTAGVAINIVYYTISIGKWGRTIGKRIFGLQVLTADGKKVGYLRAFVRFLCYYVDFLTLFFGFFMIAWNKDRRGLHDLLAGTIVIRRNL
ncbi:MAG: hypothetical protein EXR59_05185 [Dehalococcoidia bacterium]|nr:hypothetical protein [Dehalococcoidia bacterium]